jgi:23S rRNA pseudouridine2604 synthase
MCEYLEYEVVSLKRERIMNISLGNLQTGKWRDLTEVEINGLKAAVTDSDNTPAANKSQRITRKSR